LTADAGQTLSALGPMIKKKAGTHTVRVDGYTDSIGSDSYNQALSERRARSVRDWLAAHNYVAGATQIRGFGKENPVAPNTNADGSDNSSGRQKNRRVEVVIRSCPP
jgi:outer membrane protein OmpA-like peptidoglycan-associated protein